MGAKIKKSNKVTIKGTLVIEENVIKIDIGEDDENLVDVAAQIEHLSGADIILTVSQDTEIA